jgi:hypothetical protein
MRPRLARTAKGMLVGGLAVLLVAVVAVGDDAHAELEKGEETTAGVTTYLAVQFSTTRCDDGDAYKINMVSRRWYRSSLRRTVQAQYETHRKGLRCNGDLMKESHSSGVFKPCFGCDGTSRRWTRDYTSSYTWPYVRQCHCREDQLGAVVQTAVKSRRGRRLGYGCVKVALLGSVDSTLC